MNSAWPMRKEDGYLGSERIHLWRLAPQEDTLHGHEFFELAYVMSGSSQHQLGAQTIRVQEGDYFIIDVGSPHCYRENRGFVIVNCLFAPEYVDRALVNCPSLSALLSTQVRQFGVPALGGKAADRLYHDADGSIRRLIEAMEKEYAARETGYLELLRCHLIEILVRTVRADSGGEPAGGHPAVAAMAEYLHEHMAQPLSLAALSAKLGYTQQYLSSLFHQETGTSLSTYLQKLRVDAGCRMLTGLNMSISAVAQEVGYSDSKHFNRVFRRYMGVSPREFRSRQGASAHQPIEKSPDS